MSTNRASLLAGLRTGGVRSTSLGMPQTAAPTASFAHHDNAPMSAALAGAFPNYAVPPPTALSAQDAQALQLQLMQMEIMRLQAIQQQQLQFELLRQQNAGPPRRAYDAYEAPASAAPTTTSFRNVRPSQAEQLKAQLGLTQKPVSEEPQVPMTASLNGKFGTRLNPNAATFRLGGVSEESAQTGFNSFANSPATANFTTVISGGTALGNGSSNGNGVSNGTTERKSDSVSNWRRGGNGNSMWGGRRTATINVTITPPPGERLSPPLPALTRSRPSPLQLDTMTDNLAALNMDGSDGDLSDAVDDTGSSNPSDSLPATPPSAGSHGADHLPPLSPREEASKRLYEGLGIGRPTPVTAVAPQTAIPAFAAPFAQEITVPHTSVGAAFSTRSVSAAPVRQPRGPPSDKDELGPKNFATRIRKKAIGGLGAMLDARVSRTAVEVC